MPLSASPPIPKSDMPKSTRLFYVRCNGDGSWLTTRRNAGGGHIFERAPADPMLASGPVLADWKGAYELIPTPWTVETWPQPVMLDDESKAALCDAAEMLMNVPGGHQHICDTLRRLARGATLKSEELILAIAEAHKALGGDSNDDEHEALLSPMAALGEEEV